MISGPFRVDSRDQDRVVLVRNQAYAGVRPGNVARVEFVRSAVASALEPYRKDALDMVSVRYTPRIADRVPSAESDAAIGPAAWSGYIAFDHSNPLTADIELRRALAHAVDREALAGALPANMLAATGGIVPPALQGHTPDIALRFDPEAARAYLARSAFRGDLTIGALDEWAEVIATLVREWKRVLGIDIATRSWSAVEAAALRRPWDIAPMVVTGWLPGYPDPEYYLRLLFQSDSRTNEGGFAHAPFDALIEQARHERGDRTRLALFHEADRLAVADRVAVIPLVYGRSMAFVKPWIRGWWEFGKSSSSFADLVVDPISPRA